MSVGILWFTELKLPQLLSEASKLDQWGCLFRSMEGLTYLDIDDRYIHELFPLLPYPQITKPDYFGAGLMGAHVSAIYPEENKVISHEDLGKKHAFNLVGIFSAELNLKKYYVLAVASPSLAELRRKYGLSEKPWILGHQVNFHITLGVAPH